MVMYTLILVMDIIIPELLLMRQQIILLALQKIHHTHQMHITQLLIQLIMDIAVDINITLVIILIQLVAMVHI